MEDITIRDYIPLVDDNFIFDSWIHSYYGQSPMTVLVPRKEYQDQHSKLISKLIPKCKIKVAADPEDLDLIVGYIVYETAKIHYVYVKEQFRKFGICHKLLESAHAQKGTRVTHMTIRYKTIAEKQGFVYSPYFDL
jgi:hypothetical protein